MWVAISGNLERAPQFRKFALITVKLWSSANLHAITGSEDLELGTFLVVLHSTVRCRVPDYPC
jgi:hypothetical protein